MTPPPLDASPLDAPSGAAPTLPPRTTPIIPPPVATCVDLLFPVVGGATVPIDHGYALFGAVSRLVPAAHDAAAGVGLFPLRGAAAPDGKTLRLAPDRTVLRVRVPAGQIPLLLPLAGQALELDGHRLRLGVPRVAALVPAPAVWSSLVLIKLAHAEGHGSVTPERFLSAARKQLDALGVGESAEVGLPVYADGPLKGQPRRRTVRVRGQTHAGYAVAVRGLTADESVRLQSAGLGGRRRQGCGLFLPENTSS